MFPIAHAWLIERLTIHPQPAHFLGCVWPDMLFASPLSHPQSHRSGALLIAALHADPARSVEAGVLHAFVAGALSHGIEPHGFDWYSDEQYGTAPHAARGYAFQHGQALAQETAHACDVRPEDGLWKAHNIIEMAFERGLYAADPTLGERIVAACADATLVDVVTHWLGDVFGLPAAELATAIGRFTEVVELRPARREALAAVYARQTRLKHPGAQPDADGIATLIARAEHLIASDHEAFLAACVASVGALLAGTLPA
jgi:hypothetical protein